MATDAQRRARDKWNSAHKEKRKKYSYKSTAKNFIINYSDLKDLEELKLLIKEKEKELLKED